MKYPKIKVRITFLEEMLGTKPADPEIFATYIASKHPKGTPERDELDSAEQSEITGTTGFFRDEAGNPVVYNYQMRGFFKEACTFMKQVPGACSALLVAHNTKIDGLVYVTPRQIVLRMPIGGEIGVCERSLRANTPQGPRVALARSETVPAGTSMEFWVKSYLGEFIAKVGDKKVKIGFEHFLREWFTFGGDHGFGQWRNSGKGAFEFEILERTYEENDLPVFDIKPEKAEKPKKSDSKESDSKGSESEE